MEAVDFLQVAALASVSWKVVDLVTLFANYWHRKVFMNDISILVSLSASYNGRGVTEDRGRPGLNPCRPGLYRLLASI